MTLLELEDSIRDMTSIDQFKHMSTVMADRMVQYVKEEYVDEAKVIQNELDKLLKKLTNNNKK